MSQESPYWQQRINQAVARMATPAYQKRNFTFFENQDPESRRRAGLPRLNQYSDYVRVDPEGFIYVSHWSKTSRIPIGAKILGAHQEWRDYSADPPKTKQFYRHNFDRVRGIDVGLRRAIEVRDQYKTGGAETMAVLATLQRIGELRKELIHLKDLSEEELNGIIEANQKALEEQVGFKRPMLPSKERSKRHLLANLLDKNGRRNTGALMMRYFAVELGLYQRWEGSFPPILGKLASIVEVLEFERGFARQNLVWAGEKLADVVSLLPDGVNSLKLEQSLVGVSFSLRGNVVVKPYSTVAREVVDSLGAGRMRSDIPNVMQLMRNGQTERAQTLLTASQVSLQAILDDYADFMTVERGVRTPRKRDMVMEAQREIPVIFQS